MNPYMMQDLAAARDRDLREQAVAARRASRARRARRARRGGAAAGPSAAISRRGSAASQPAGI
jgi:hypothetical protein